MDDLSIEKIEISGPTLASLIQRASSSLSKVDDLIFGITSSYLSGNSPADSHEYRAYQFRSSKQRLEPRSVGTVNIGPAFRGHYCSFSPKLGFPPLICELDSLAMIVDCNVGSLSAKKQEVKDHEEIDALAEGLQVGNLKRLVGAEAANYTGGIEEIYERMLAKIQSLASG